MAPLRPLASLFDTLQRAWDGPRQPRVVGSVLTVAFVTSLVAIEASRQGWLPAPLAGWVPRNHFHAVDLAFTLLLLFEVIGVVFSLAHSVSQSVGKQFEIFSLILLRQSFKELTGFAEPVVWEQVSGSIRHMASDAAGALVVFVLIGLFYRLQRHRPITSDAHDRESFIAAKKALAVLLLGAFVALGASHAWQSVTGGTAHGFFEAFYTLLIFTDVLLVLVSLCYSSTYHVVFRNSGFAAATLFLRLALTAPPFVNAAIGIASVLLACGLTLAYNAFATSFDQAAARR